MVWHNKIGNEQELYWQPAVFDSAVFVGAAAIGERSPGGLRRGDGELRWRAYRRAMICWPSRRVHKCL
jgi:hypothetical protein